MMNYAPALLTAALLASAASDKPTHAEAQEIARITRDIRMRGARDVLEWLHDHPKRLFAVLEGIRSADRAWLKVGQDLFAGADAGYAYEINLAFGDALPKSPEAVLEMAPELDVTCGSIDSPFIENLEKALLEVSRREKTVREVGNSALTKQKARCLEALSQLRTAIPKGYQK
jgi:hypothetical protein